MPLSDSTHNVNLTNRKRQRTAKVAAAKADTADKQENQAPAPKRSSRPRADAKSKKPTKAVAQRPGVESSQNKPADRARELACLSYYSDDSSEDEQLAPPPSPHPVMPLLLVYDSKVNKYNAVVDDLVKEVAPISTLSIQVHYAGRRLICTLEKETYIRNLQHLAALDSMDMTPFEAAFVCHPAFELQEQMLNLFISGETEPSRLTFAEVAFHLCFVAQCRSIEDIFPRKSVKELIDKYEPIADNVRSAEEDEDDARIEPSEAERIVVCLTNLKQWCNFIPTVDLGLLAPGEMAALVFALCRICLDSNADASITDACAKAMDKVLGGLSKEYTDEVIEALGLMLMDLDDCYGAHLRIIKLFGDVGCLAVHRQYFVAVLVAGLLGQAEEQGLFETFKMAPPKDVPPAAKLEKNQCLYGVFIELPNLVRVLLNESFRADGATVTYNVLAMLVECVNVEHLYGQGYQGIEFFKDRLDASLLHWNPTKCFDHGLFKHMAEIVYERVRGVESMMRGSNALGDFDLDLSDDEDDF
ncbi:hypothetical protein AAVH_04489 [Aphelenchoides avenae]|nr:hypothetical protein AAVH_04489 [Aphelenchus avenae]